jgi:hypothetical protein
MEEEFDLLCEAITNEGEAKRNGVSYMYVSDNVIYRFEDGKMKKVAAKLIKKAQNSIKQQQNKQQNKQQQQQPEESTQEESTNDETPEESTQEPTPKRQKTKSSNPKPPKIPTTQHESSNLNIDEYYNNKYKLTYMEQEIDRLNGKINKLKHYKHLFNRIGGNTNEEIDELPTQKQPPQVQQVQQVQQPEREQVQRRTDLFMF